MEHNLFSELVDFLPWELLKTRRRMCACVCVCVCLCVFVCMSVLTLDRCRIRRKHTVYDAMAIYNAMASLFLRKTVDKGSVCI